MSSDVNDTKNCDALDLQRIAEIVLDHAKKLGMDQAEVSLHNGTGVSITARLGELETVEKHNDSQVVVAVYNDHKTGTASSADMTEQGLRESVEAAVSIARYTEADECFGLADKELMAPKDQPDLQLYHPWEMTEAQLVELALACEQSAMDYDEKITNSEGASVSSYSGSSVYANSHGFMGINKGSQHSMSCSVIGSSNGSSNSSMQRDYWYDSNRDASKLLSAQAIGEEAARRTIKRLDGRKISSCEVPVLFDATIAKSLVGHMLGAIKGGAIYKKASFLLDKVGESILPDFITIAENPHILGAAASANFDQEGVATPEYRAIVENGVLQSYVMASYTARKLKLQTTANAGGVRNLTVSNTGQDFETLIAQMGTGLLVTELIGSGINQLTGDYSRGAAGFWVENGEVQYPVEEITIAGNLIEMYQNIIAVGSDTDSRGNTACGSILLDKMTIAGA